MKLEVRIAAVTGIKDGPPVLYQAASPQFNHESIPVDFLKSLMEMFLAQLPAAVANALPSLPKEKAGGPDQSRFQQVAHQMLARIDAGKINARCLIYEKDGEQHLLLITPKEPTNAS